MIGIVMVNGHIIEPTPKSMLRLAMFSPIKVLLQTYIEHLRGLVEDKKTINHHGREREIDLDLMNEKSVQVKPAVIQAFDLE